MYKSSTLSPLGWVSISISIMVFLFASTEGETREKDDGYGSFYILRSSPKDENLHVGTDEIPKTSLSNGIGAGLKVGSYLGNTKGVLGIEGEIFVTRGDVEAPQTTIGGVTRFANGDLTGIDWMINLLVRYPGEFFQPYIGVGGGLSMGFLTGIDIQNRTHTVFGDASSTAFAYQFLAGIRVNASKRIFLFGEYKYFGTKFDWDTEVLLGPGPPPPVLLDFRTQLISGGMGIRF